MPAVLTAVDHPAVRPRPSGGRSAGQDRRDRHLIEMARASGDPGARTRAVTELLPLARGLARRYARGGEPLEDLEQVACIGLLKAVDGFDLERDTPFSAYAIPTITGELRRHFRDKGWMIRPPRSLQELSLRAEAEIHSSPDHVPTATELADRLGVSVERLLEAREAREAMRPASLDRPMQTEADAAGDPLVEMLGDVDPGYERIEESSAVGERLRALSRRDREILEMRFGAELTQSEIGDRLGVSQMHISRLLRGILASLSTTAYAGLTPDLRTASAT